MYGWTCFKCHGAGTTLTKRGHAAQVFFRDLCSKPLGDVKIGELMQVEDMSRRYFARVVEIERDFVVGRSRRNGTGEMVEHRGTRVVTEHAKFGRSGLTASPEHIVRMGQTAEEKAEKRAAALAYQDTLTKAGTVSKRAAKKGAAS